MKILIVLLIALFAFANAAAAEDPSSSPRGMVSTQAEEITYQPDYQGTPVPGDATDELEPHSRGLRKKKSKGGKWKHSWKSWDHWKSSSKSWKSSRWSSKSNKWSKSTKWSKPTKWSHDWSSTKWSHDWNSWDNDWHWGGWGWKNKRTAADNLFN